MCHKLNKTSPLFWAFLLRQRNITLKSSSEYKNEIRKKWSTWNKERVDFPVARGSQVFLSFWHVLTSSVQSTADNKKSSFSYPWCDVNKWNIRDVGNFGCLDLVPREFAPSQIAEHGLGPGKDTATILSFNFRI